MTDFTDPLMFGGYGAWMLAAGDRLLVDDVALQVFGPEMSITISGTLRSREGPAIFMISEDGRVEVTEDAVIRAGFPSPNWPISARASGAALSGDNIELINGGIISGLQGINLSGDASTLVNTGRLIAHGSGEGMGTGARLYGNSTEYQNFGMIRGVDFGVDLGSFHNQDIQFSNYRQIIGDIAMQIEGENVDLFNRGKLIGEGGTALTLKGNNGLIVNLGEIVGDVVALGGHQDITNLGHVEGTIRLGADGDRFSGIAENGVYGQGGRDWIYGDLRSDDRVFGGQAGDFLFGRAGNDLIVGGLGNDRMTGGAGADRFVFRPRDGQDQIHDFEANDVIRLKGLSYSSMAEMIAENRIVEQGNDLIVLLPGAGDRLILRDFAGSALTENNFEFA